MPETHNPWAARAVELEPLSEDAARHTPAYPVPGFGPARDRLAEVRGEIARDQDAARLHTELDLVQAELAAAASERAALADEVSDLTRERDQLAHENGQLAQDLDNALDEFAPLALTEKAERLAVSPSRFAMQAQA